MPRPPSQPVQHLLLVLPPFFRIQFHRAQDLFGCLRVCMGAHGRDADEPHGLRFWRWSVLGVGYTVGASHPFGMELRGRGQVSRLDVLNVDGFPGRLGSFSFGGRSCVSFAALSVQLVSDASVSRPRRFLDVAFGTGCFVFGSNHVHDLGFDVWSVPRLDRPRSFLLSTGRMDGLRAVAIWMSFVPCFGQEHGMDLLRGRGFDGFLPSFLLPPFHLARVCTCHRNVAQVHDGRIFLPCEVGLAPRFGWVMVSFVDRVAYFHACPFSTLSFFFFFFAQVAIQGESVHVAFRDGSMSSVSSIDGSACLGSCACAFVVVSRGSMEVKTHTQPKRTDDRRWDGSKHEMGGKRGWVGTPWERVHSKPRMSRFEPVPFSRGGKGRVVRIHPPFSFEMGEEASPHPQKENRTTAEEEEVRFHPPPTIPFLVSSSGQVSGVKRRIQGAPNRVVVPSSIGLARSTIPNCSYPTRTVSRPRPGDPVDVLSTPKGHHVQAEPIERIEGRGRRCTPRGRRRRWVVEGTERCVSNPKEKDSDHPAVP